MRAVICAIAKCENKYINNWCKYHLDLGFDHIYIYDNNDSSYPRVENFIDEDIKYKITFFNIRDTHKQAFQDEVYTKFYNNYKEIFDWCAYIDIDEFIELNGFKNINDFLSQEKFKKFEVIRLRWHLYGDDDLIERDESIPVYKAFHKHLTNVKKAKQCKTIIRGNLKGVEFHSSHYPSRDNEVLKQCMSNGIPSDVKISYWYDMDEAAWINHYMTKSLKEFLEQKLGRTDAQFAQVRLDLDYYWALNTKTPEKEAYIKNYIETNGLEKSNKNNYKKIFSKLKR